MASAPGVYYIHEPFNKKDPPGICPVQFERWFQHIGPHKEETFGAALARTTPLRFALGHHLVSALHPGRSHYHGGVRGMGWAFPEWYRWTRARIHGALPLIKNPFSLLSAEWLSDRFDAHVIVLVRHPAGFVRSVQKLEWKHDFREFTEQTDLLDGPLAPYEEELEEAVQRSGDLLQNAALLWKILYGVVAEYRDRHPDWKIVRMEDLSTQPLSRFRALWEYLNLAVDSEMKQAVQEFTDADAPSSEDVGPYTVKRDSEKQAWRWRTQLSTETIHEIRE